MYIIKQKNDCDKENADIRQGSLIKGSMRVGISEQDIWKAESVENAMTSVSEAYSVSNVT